MAIFGVPLAVFAATLSVVAYLPYAYAIVRGRAQPQRASWLIWSVLSTMAFLAVLSEGGSKSLMFTGSQTAGTIAIFLMSFWRGAGSFWSRTDMCVLGVAGLGLCLWWWTDAAGWAMALSIAIGSIGGVLTVLNAYWRPAFEAVVPWTLQVLAAILGVGSVMGGTALEIAYPLYLLVLYAAILGAALLGRARCGRVGANFDV
jgi:hypothetical protein